MKHELPVFALLIDADNVNKEAIVPIIEEVTRHGRIAVGASMATSRRLTWLVGAKPLPITASTPFSSTGTPSEKMLATVH
jgi:hypothetical protein